MAITREAALRKIQAALDIANHPNTSQEEAAVAFAGAARLMAKYEIEDGEIGCAGRTQIRTKVGQMTFSVDNMDNAGTQRRSAVFRIVNALGASAVYTPVRNGTGSGVYGFRIEIFAVESTIQFLELLLPQFILQLENMLNRDAAAHRTKLKNSGYYSGNTLAREVSGYRRTYIAAFGEAVAVKVASFRKEAIDESTQSGTAAIVLKSDHDRAEAARNAAHPKMTTNNARQNLRNAAGLRDGYAAGSRALVGQTDVNKGGRRALS